MHFELFQRRYVVSIAPRALILDGQPCRAKLDRVRGIIWISDQLPRNLRRRELFHELRHVWIDHRGRAEDDEADAQQTAEMMDVLMEAYLEQGGDAVLEALSPQPDTSTTHNAAGTGMYKADPTCGYCHARILPGNVGTDPPTWNADLSQHTVMRGALCQICDRVTVWHEEATADGMPRGIILPFPAPTLLDGAEAGEWIGKHPRACQCIMAGE